MTGKIPPVLELTCKRSVEQHKIGFSDSTSGSQRHGSHVSQMGILGANQSCTDIGPVTLFSCDHLALGSLYILAKYPVGCWKREGSLLATHRPPKNAARANIRMSQRANLRPQHQKEI